MALTEDQTFTVFLWLPEWRWRQLQWTRHSDAAARIALVAAPMDQASCLVYLSDMVKSLPASKSERLEGLGIFSFTWLSYKEGGDMVY